MNPLQYTSEEMFSSTELIRKSKKVFDKLQKEEIEKAIILRDGKPAFMLLDFAVYEKIMNEYITLKRNHKNKTQKKEKRQVIEEPLIEKPKLIEEHVKELNPSELNEEDLEKALEQIENLNLDELSETPEIEEEKEPLKDFWEK